MHGSTSPAKYGSPSCSHRTFSRTRPTATRAASLLSGSTPNARSSTRLQVVEVHAGKSVPRRSGPNECHHLSAAPEGNVGVPAGHWPCGCWRASNRPPQPSPATRVRSAATSSSGASVRSRITCQRIAGSLSSSQSMTSTHPTSPRKPLALHGAVNSLVSATATYAQEPAPGQRDTELRGPLGQFAPDLGGHRVGRPGSPRPRRRRRRWAPNTAGHADIVRKLLDGAKGYYQPSPAPLRAAAPVWVGDDCTLVKVP